MSIATAFPFPVSLSFSFSLIFSDMLLNPSLPLDNKLGVLVARTAGLAVSLAARSRVILPEEGGGAMFLVEGPAFKREAEGVPGTFSDIGERGGLMREKGELMATDLFVSTRDRQVEGIAQSGNRSLIGVH